jgi:gliding motility-associated-like protein
MHCGATGSATISMKPDEQQSLPTTIVCANVPTTIPLEQFGFVNPMISINNGGLSCTDCLNPEVTISQTTTLFIESESQNPGSCRLTSSMVLLIPAGDDVTFDLGSDPPYGQGEVVSITLVTDPMPPAGTLYSWSVNNIPVAGSSATINAPLNEVSNTIHVEWINSFGCIQTADTIIITKEPSIRIPKAFTPDRTMNSHFKVEITGNFEIVEMLVFNRWGQVVYEGTTEQGWDGRRNGEPAPPEVYAYLIKLRNPSGDIIIEKGDVTLVR